MAKARAIVKRRKAVRNIRKITKTMQMIATAKFQKSLRRAVGTKPYTQKVRELVAELARTVGNVHHPLLRRPSEADRTGRVALLVLTSNRGLAGAYNGSVLRAAAAFIHEQESAGRTVELYVSGKKGVSYFKYQKRPIVQTFDQFADMPRYADVNAVAEQFMKEFVEKRVDSVHIAHMNFISAGQQKPDVLTLLPLAGVVGERGEQGTRKLNEAMQSDAVKEGHPMAPASTGATVSAALPGGAKTGQMQPTTTYDFYPDAKSLLDELLPLTVKTALFQCFLDATTSENVARMIAMKSATDNADKMVKSLTMQYNRARQSQITTELSEIMGGVEAMEG